MKQRGLQNNKFLSLLISFILLTFTLIPVPAHAVAIGSGSCASIASTSSVVVANSGGYCYLAVTATGANSWTIPAGVSTINFILIAGGGAGGAGAWGGGGGAGELVYQTSYAVTVGATLNYSIGTGGASGTATLTPADNRSNNGVDSWVGSSSGVVAKGGGAGASYAYSSGVVSYGTGSNGGSGGGGTEDSTTRSGGSSTASTSTNRTGYGNSGGSGGPGAGTQSGGGGGGSGGSGTNAGTGTGGTGGAGTTAFSTYVTAIRASMVSAWQTATTTGAIAAGGGGGTTTTAGAGGAGGGGAGGSNSTSYPGTSAIANTGSGGGGSGYGGTARLGGAGASGLLIIRYAVPDTTAPVITGPSSSTGSTSSISIAETATTVFTFTANESVSWTKSGTDSSFFTIASNGALTITLRNFEAPADSDGNNSYIVVITATDDASNVTNQTLTLTITNVNEAPVITNNSSAATYLLSQAENISTVVTFTATDVDTATTLTWSLSGTDASDFSINTNTGDLAFFSNPDFEAPADSDTNNAYIVIVTVSDGALTDTQTVTVTITDTNEFAALGAPSVSGTIYKGLSVTITVTSNTAGKVRFSISGKRIPTCLAVATIGSGSNYTATCTWKPAVQNRQYLTASITPTLNTFWGITSPRSDIYIFKRSSNR